VVNGDVSLSTAGMTYQGRDVRGCIRVTAPNVTIKNVKVTCNSGGGRNYTRVNTSSTGLLLADVEINCLNDFGSAIGSDNFTALRVNVHNCENGFNVGAPGNVLIRDSYIHDLWVDANDDAHADGIQIGEGASNLTIYHNVIHNPNGQTAAIIMWNEGGAQNNNVAITNNLLAGGGYTLYCGRVGTSVNVAITGNRFGPSRFSYANSCTGSHITTWANNVRDATGAVLSPQ
jgi:hypothetical protein